MAALVGAPPKEPMSSQSVPEPQAGIGTYGLIRQAIEKRQQVIATYHGFRREMCPHSIGVNRRGERQALSYQFAGQSSQILGPPGSPNNWRCLRVDELTDVSLRDGDWHTAPDHTRPQTCVFRHIDLTVGRWFNSLPADL
jgi:hypothetical protein